MRIEIHPDGTITIDTDPTADAEPGHDTTLDAMVENTAPAIPFGFTPAPTRTTED